jgi:hypothetical protein
MILYRDKRGEKWVWGRGSVWRGTQKELKSYGSAQFHSYCETDVRSQKSGIRDQGSGIRDQGSGIRDQGSGIRDQGSDDSRTTSEFIVPEKRIIICMRTMITVFEQLRANGSA